jgi:hypothetical protein
MATVTCIVCCWVIAASHVTVIRCITCEQHVLLSCRLLGVREFDPSELVGLIKDMAAAGELPSSNLPQLQQLLVCVFGLLFNTTPSQQQQQQLSAISSSGAAATPVRDVNSTPQRQTLTPFRAGGVSGGGAAAATSSIRAKLLLRELKTLPLLPVMGRPGLLVAAKGGATSFNAAAAAASTTDSSGSGLDVGNRFDPSAEVFFPLSLSSSSSSSGSGQQSVLSTPPRPPRYDMPPTPTSASRSRVPLHSTLRALNTPGGPVDSSNAAAAAAAVGGATAAQLAEVALQHCGITQQQLAGAGAESSGSSSADGAQTAAAAAAGEAGQLLFVEPQLLQLDDQETLGYLVKGLKVRFSCKVLCNSYMT